MLISTFQTNDDNVTSFNGRKGDVTPQSGDYTADQVGAAPAEHNHDDQYYTESEIDTKLTSKSDTSHTHNYAGLKTEGNNVKPTPDSSIVAGTGAEIFNDYRERTYNDTGIILRGNVASGSYSHAEGIFTTASGNHSHAEGYQTEATGSGSHSEGFMTEATGSYSHSEGSMTEATGSYSHSEGFMTEATAESAHAEGMYTDATGERSHAEGYFTKATGDNSHVEGHFTKAIGQESHAEGYKSYAIGKGSHAEGESVVATDLACHAEGCKNIASAVEQIFTVESYNAAEKSFVLSSTLSTDEALFNLMTEGIQVSIINNYYTNSSDKFTINSVDVSDRKIIVNETIPAEKYTPTTGVILLESNKARGIHTEGSNVIACNICAHAEGVLLRHQVNILTLRDIALMQAAIILTRKEERQSQMEIILMRKGLAQRQAEIVLMQKVLTQLRPEKVLMQKGI